MLRNITFLYLLFLMCLDPLTKFMVHRNDCIGNRLLSFYTKLFNS